jgi:hypothetical protein
MVKSKVTISLDRAKVEQARCLVDAASVSETIDWALDHLIHDERIKRDIAAYTAMPQTAEDTGHSPRGYIGLDDDDTDWAAAYGLSPERQR